MNPNRARDHLANERTFLAWLRTGVAVFGFAIGRFAVAMRQMTAAAGRPASIWTPANSNPPCSSSMSPACSRSC